jgi:hypothetical protein
LTEHGKPIRLSPELSSAKRKQIIEKYGAKNGELRCVDDGSAKEWFEARARGAAMLSIFQRNHLNLNSGKVMINNSDWQGVRIKECENSSPDIPPTSAPGR